jgi:hypothetical protein
MTAPLSTRLRMLERQWGAAGCCAKHEAQLIVLDGHAQDTPVRGCSRCGRPAVVIRIELVCVPDRG